MVDTISEGILMVDTMNTYYKEFAPFLNQGIFRHLPEKTSTISEDSPVLDLPAPGLPYHLLRFEIHQLLFHLAS